MCVDSSLIASTTSTRAVLGIEPNNYQDLYVFASVNIYIKNTYILANTSPKECLRKSSSNYILFISFRVRIQSHHLTDIIMLTARQGLCQNICNHEF